MKSISFLGAPHSCNNLKNYSITTATLYVDFKVGLLPVMQAPINQRAGISRGKLKGLIIHTGP